MPAQPLLLRIAGLALLSLWGSPVPAHSQESTIESHWGQWRGPLGTGEAPQSVPVTTWSEQQNVRWKAPLPGLSHSSPIVWGDRVFVTTTVPVGPIRERVPDDAPGAHNNAPVTREQEFVVMALSRETGEVLWSKPVHRQLPHAGAHDSSSISPASPVTDGELVFASFGSYGIYALSLDGELVWQVDLGDMQIKHGHGEGSSPVLYGDILAVNWDHEGESFVVALDRGTGKERWRAAREEVTSWSSPIVIESEGKAQLIIPGTERVRSYELRTGKLLWQCGGLSHNIVATPVFGDGLLFVCSSYEKRAMFAIRVAGASGDITGTDHVVWSRRHRTPYVPSPLLYGGALYFLNHYQGVLSRVRAADGEEALGPFRIDGLSDIYASPVAAAGHVYITDLEGMTVVLRHTTTQPEVVALNQINDKVSASMAIAGDEIFLRGERFLYCIAQTAPKTPPLK